MALSLDAGSAGLSISPTSSGRASPVSRKWALLGSGEYYWYLPLLQVTKPPVDEPSGKDKAFRRYASGVERSLSLFDTALQEWADYISFLGRLLKV